MLTVNSLSCERGEHLLFKDLNFALAPGEVLQITGRNGAGKSSLLKILAGLAFPTAGTINWNKQSIDNDKAAYHSAICYLGHLNGIKAGLTVAENLYFSRCLMPAILINEQTAIEYLGLANYAHTLVENLSAGQQRRVALARLLLSSAKLWILDEPFTSLDKQTITLLEQLFVEHCNKDGMIIMATHQTLQISSIPMQNCELT